MIGRLATGLKKLPAEIRSMTLPQAFQLFRYWNDNPPEHELLAIALQVYTSWRPNPKPVSKEAAAAEQRASLEQRWKAGAMNAKQLFEMTGGVAVNPMARA